MIHVTKGKMEIFLNTYGGWIILWLVFQVGINTFVRLLSTISFQPFYSRKMYLLVMIPGFGVLIAVYKILSIALTKDQK